MLVLLFDKRVYVILTAAIVNLAPALAMCGCGRVGPTVGNHGTTDAKEKQSSTSAVLPAADLEVDLTKKKLVRGTFHWDIDTDKDGHSDTSDLWLEHAGDPNPFITPVNGAQITRVNKESFEEIRITDLRDCKFTDQRISTETVEPNANFAVRTASGSIYKLQILYFLPLANEKHSIAKYDMVLLYAPLSVSTNPLEGNWPGELREFTSLKIKMIWCPSGEFKMGAPPGDSLASEWEKPQSDVFLSNGFWLAESEVSQEQWTKVATANWSQSLNSSQRPANYMTWDEAVKFCQDLTEQERKAGRLPNGWRYCLPTEAQWEYACRAGTSSRYFFGNDAAEMLEYAWVEENLQDNTNTSLRDVGAKKANPWGFKDMYGNAWEWCRDEFKTPLLGGTDPLQKISPEGEPVQRGGSSRSPAEYCRSTVRSKRFRNYRGGLDGFRLALCRE